MDWQTCPCPSDTGLEDWQRLVENCQISQRLSSNWLKWIGGLVLGLRFGSGLAVCRLDWPGIDVMVCAKSSSLVETLRSVDKVLLFPVYWDNCLPIGV